MSKSIDIPNSILRRAEEYERRVYEASTLGMFADIEEFSLPNINMYGIPLSELLTSELSANRCHQTAVAMSLALPNSKIIFANLRNRATKHYVEDMQSGDTQRIEMLKRECELLKQTDPTYNHSYIEVRGQDILNSGISFITKNLDKFKIDKDKTYIIDPQMRQITDEDTFNFINYPHIILFFERPSDSPIWRTLNEQKNIKGRDYKLKELNNLLKNVYRSGDREFDKYLASIIHLDITLLSKRENSNKQVFTSYNDIVALMSI